MSISEHINCLVYTIVFKCNSEKQYKRHSNHHFPLHLPQKTKHNYGENRYAALKWYSLNFQWVLGMQLIGGGGEIIYKDLGNSESTLAGIREKKLQN